MQKDHNQATGMWARATKIAEMTPTDRNRYVDLMRAFSISVVVLGHWLMAAPYLDAGSPKMEHLLDIQPWSQWLTWGLQVMPVFFFVGGFSNGVSWDSAQRRKQTYAMWLELRMRRLLGPVMPLVMLWIAAGIIGFIAGVPTGMIRLASQIALVPVWFLAIYFLIVTLVPVTRWAWRSYGYLSVVAPMLLAIVGDLMFFHSSMQWLGWFNYLFVWSAIHQLGYAWQQGRLTGVAKSLVLACIGAIALVSLTHFGPYPISLVGVPSQEFSNTTPPKLPLLALGLAQIGLLLLIEAPMRRLLDHPKPWTITVLVNGFIMPVFLWHSTVMMLLIGASFWLLPEVLVAHPGTAHWWGLRPVWVAVFLIFMLLLLPLFLGLEKILTRNPRTEVSTSRLMIAGASMCSGLALLASSGVTGNGVLGLNWIACLLPLAGGFLALFRTPKF